MKLSRSTLLLMCLSLETLTSITRTGSPILVELIDLVNSVIIFRSQMTLLRWKLFYSDPWLWFSQSCSCGFLYFLWRYSLFYDDFPSIGKFWSCSCLSFHWLSNKFKMGCPVSLHSLYDYSRADWDSPRDHLRDVPWEDIFKPSAPAASSKFCD